MTQPEALRLADLLLSENAMDCLEHSDDAAAELRRLYEENQTLRQALAQPEQEKVYTKQDMIDVIDAVSSALHRKWVELTEEEIINSLEKSNLPSVFSYRMAARAIERKLKEKNT